MSSDNALSESLAHERCSTGLSVDDTMACCNDFAFYLLDLSGLCNKADGGDSLMFY